ncbi:hypothetical protein [Candidatus Pyrohabitans sp.]
MDAIERGEMDYEEALRELYEEEEDRWIGFLFAYNNNNVNQLANNYNGIKVLE